MSCRVRSGRPASGCRRSCDRRAAGSSGESREEPQSGRTRCRTMRLELRAVDLRSPRHAAIGARGQGPGARRMPLSEPDPLHRTRRLWSVACGPWPRGSSFSTGPLRITATRPPIARRSSSRCSRRGQAWNRSIRRIGPGARSTESDLRPPRPTKKHPPAAGHGVGSHAYGQPCRLRTTWPWQPANGGQASCRRPLPACAALRS